MQSLSGKVAVITGAASGIGQALATRLATEGCHLALADIDLAQLERSAAILRGGEIRVSCHALDVAGRAAVHAFAERVLSEHG